MTETWMQLFFEEKHRTPTRWSTVTVFSVILFNDLMSQVCTKEVCLKKHDESIRTAKISKKLQKKTKSEKIILAQTIIPVSNF